MPRIAASASGVPRPVVKWAGGKSKLAEWLVDQMPERIGTYAEPFCGGAAVFFRLAADEKRTFDRAILTDKNEHLIACYRAIQKDVESLITRLAALAAKYERLGTDDRRKLFYKMRDDVKPKTDVDRGARMLFLNKTCFNGLWRENASGQNNVPFGRYANPKILDRSALRAASRALERAELHVWDYARATKGLGSTDFVYFDPPYVPVSKTANFTSYAKAGFGPDDQKKLRDLLRDLRDRGVKAMLSNSRTPVTDDLYVEFGVEIVPMARSINSKPSKRGDVEELVVFNWRPPAAARKAAS